MKECRSFNDLLKQTCALMNRGYYFYVYEHIRADKEGHVKEIVRKIADKFPDLALHKVARYRLRQAGGVTHSLYFYKRNIVVLARGIVEVEDAEEFRDIRREPLVLHGDNESYAFIYDRTGHCGAGAVRIYLERRTFRRIRDSFLMALKARDKGCVEGILRRLKRIPAFKGVCEQMKNLRVYLKSKSGRDPGALHVHLQRVGIKPRASS